MGPSPSKGSQLSFMKDYEIVQQNPVENITLLQHKTTEEEYLLKQFNFNDKKQCEKTMQKLAQLKLKLAGNKHVVPLTDYLMSSEDQYCSTFYKIYALFQYPHRTLDDEINERKLRRNNFAETELWSILACCILGLSHLQKNNIKHSSLKSKNILIQKTGVTKIADPFATGQPTNYQAALTKRSTQHIYLSPQQTQALQQENASPNINSYRSDIWTLGMIMLEAGLLEYQDEECYRDQKSRIHWETVQYNIDRFGQKYSEQIRNMVGFMLNRDDRIRPDWIALEEYVIKNGDQVRRSFINEGAADNSVRYANVPDNTSKKPKINTSQPPQVSQPNAGQIGNSVVSGTIHTDPFNQYAPRVTIPQQNPNATLGRYTKPQSPRVSHNSSVYSQQPFTGQSQVPPYPFQAPMISSTGPVLGPSGFNATFSTFQPYNHAPLVTNPSTFHHLHSGFGQPGHSGLSQPLPQNPTFQNHSHMLPLRVSLIEQTRPIKNVFPADTYKTKTKFDQNLIIMTEDDYEAEENQNFNNFGYPQNIPNRVNNWQQQPSRPKFSSQLNNQQPIYQAQPQRPNTFGSPSLHFPQPAPPAPSPNFTNAPTLNIHPDMKFVTQEFKMGSRYEGYKLNGLRHGYGKFYYQDGGMYDGEWKENKMEGFGKLYYQSGKLAYEGIWKNDQFMGKGILYNQLPDVLDHGFNYQNFDDVEEFWTKYEGQFADDMKNGKGILYLSNGQRFQGNFSADSVEGPGVFYSQNGSKITGNWSNNRKIN